MGVSVRKPKMDGSKVGCSSVQEFFSIGLEPQSVAHHFAALWYRESLLSASSAEEEAVGSEAPPVPVRSLGSLSADIVETICEYAASVVRGPYFPRDASKENNMLPCICVMESFGGPGCHPLENAGFSLTLGGVPALSCVWSVSDDAYLRFEKTHTYLKCVATFSGNRELTFGFGFGMGSGGAIVSVGNSRNDIAFALPIRGKYDGNAPHYGSACSAPGLISPVCGLVNHGVNTTNPCKNTDCLALWSCVSGCGNCAGLKKYLTSRTPTQTEDYLKCIAAPTSRVIAECQCFGPESPEPCPCRQFNGAATLCPIDCPWCPARPLPTCLGHRSESLRCANAKCADREFCAADCRACPSAEHTKRASPWCSGLQACGCKDPACLERGVCCWDPKHSEFQCRSCKQHINTDCTCKGDCRQALCKGLSACHRGCAACPDGARLLGCKGITEDRVSPALHCEDECCRGRLFCAPECTSCRNVYVLKGCSGNHAVAGANGCHSEACRSIFRCAKTCKGCPDVFKRKERSDL